MKEYVLSSGVTVRVETVPALATTEIIAKQPGCRMPAPPTEFIESRKGAKEVPARKGTPEYDAYQAEVDAVLAERERVESQVFYFLGVVDWKQPGEQKFSERVPNEWKFSSRLEALGIGPREGENGRRWDYIVYELLKNAQDVNLIAPTLYGMSAITDEEESAVADKFPGDEERVADTETTDD